MGVTYSLNLIEPDSFTRAVQELRPHPFTCAQEVEEYLDRYQLKGDDDSSALVAEFTEFLDARDAGSLQFVYCQLLLTVVTRKVWYLDKSLNYYGLHKPLRTFPALKPLRFLTALTGWYTEPPEELSCESGLYGLWSAKALEATIPAIERFSTQQHASDYAASVNWNIVDRLLRRPRRSAGALKAWFEFWVFWEDIRTAIKQTVEHGWALGYAMYP